MHSSTLWFYGKHACLAALNNPNRECHELLLSSKQKDPEFDRITRKIKTHYVDKQTIEQHVSKHAVHQQVALRVSPLPSADLNHITHGPIVVLDHVTDPQNIGAILRSCAAFNAAALVVTKDHFPGETGALAKAASGALEHVPIVRVTNLETSLKKLTDSGFWCYGLDSHTSSTINTIKFDKQAVLIFGAEGKGLRPLTAKRCDFLVKLPISDRVESLNVSNAVAITLYTYQNSST